MKRFAVVSFAVGGSLARYLQVPAIMGFTMAAILAFWLIDAKYLQVERAYRVLYERARAEAAGTPASFDLRPGTARVPMGALGSWSTYLLYGPLLALLAGVWAFADWEPGTTPSVDDRRTSFLELPPRAGQIVDVSSA